MLTSAVLCALLAGASAATLDPSEARFDEGQRSPGGHGDHRRGFGLLAYERGLRVTSSVIISGTSTALVLLVGFVVLQEPLTGMRLLAIALIVGGILLLQAQGG